MLPSRVGVRNVEKVTRIDEQLYLARVDCLIEVAPGRGGVHPPRFEDIINEAIGRVMLGLGAARVEELAQRIAVEVRERQDAWRVEVRIAARYPEHKSAPASGIATQEIHTLLGTAVASERGVRRIVGVAAQGMTASPRAQRSVAADSRERLAADGFSDEQIAGIFSAVLVATDNQRGLGTLQLGLPEGAMPTWTRASCSRSWRTRCRARSTS